MKNQPSTYAGLVFVIGFTLSGAAFAAISVLAFVAFIGVVMMAAGVLCLFANVIDGMFLDAERKVLEFLRRENDAISQILKQRVDDEDGDWYGHESHEKETVN